MRVLLKVFLIFLAVLLVIAAIPYIITPVYNFPEKHPFTGDKFYNPYDSLNALGWLKANFHSHSYAWAGFTAGRENINEEIIERYKSLNYDIICISDYMKINTFLSDQKIYIPVYEHGYGFTKNHQLVIGAKEVKWLDYVFTQTLNDKQYTIEQLKRDDNIIVLNHPHLRGAYDSEDAAKLTGYDCIEIANQNFGMADDLWDAALSSGSPVFCLADDDSHNSKNYSDMGKCFNLVNTSESSADGVIKALKHGRNIAVDLNLAGGSPFDSLKNKYDNLSLPLRFEMKGNFLTIKLKQPAKEIIFTGSNGKQMAESKNIDSASCSFHETDTYIRTVIVNVNGARMYLNPVIRYNGTLPLYSASVNESATLIFRLTIIFVSIVIILGAYLLVKKRQKKLIPDVSTAQL